MTRKHFIAVAAVIKTLKDAPPVPRYREPEDRDSVLTSVAVHLAIIFEDANPDFDRKRFLAACGVE